MPSVGMLNAQGAGYFRIIITFELFQERMGTEAWERSGVPFLFASREGTGNGPRPLSYPAVELIIGQRCIEHLLYADYYVPKGGNESLEDQRGLSRKTLLPTPNSLTYPSLPTLKGEG
jgi:hypothetical protein